MKGLWLASEKDKMSLRSLKESDCVTTTGFKLKQTFGNFNPNVYVFRNMFDWNMPMWKLDRDPKYNGKIVIGWVGLTSHFEDLKKMKPILKHIHDKYSNTVFILAGMALKDTTIEINERLDGTKDVKESEVTDEKNTYRYKVKELYGDFNKNRIEILDAVGLEQYGKFYKDIDIGLSYVERNTFSQCKSEIKSVEYMKYGAVSIYSNWGGYGDMLKLMPDKLRQESRELCIDTENPNTWSEVIEKVINNIDYYKNVAGKLQYWVEDFYDVNKQTHDRIDFYNRIVEEHVEKQTHSIAKHSVLID